MKRVFVVTVGFVVLATMSIFATAQTRPGTAAPQPTPVATVPAATVPATKIAVVDTNAFGDEKTGITRYLNAVRSVQDELKVRTVELITLQNRIKVLSDEITKLSGAAVVDPKAIQAKQDEGERLQRDFKYKKEQLDADSDKRYNEVVGPVSRDIGKALDQYSTQHGLTMILDISKLLPAVLSMNPAADITLAFIADYNSKHP